jgi:predicted DNA-binding transcriptional regulator YafY
MPADYSKVHRLLRLVVLMQKGEPGNAAALADKFGITERTLYRDLNILGDLGIPYYFDVEAGGYRVRKDYFLPPLNLTAGEALALLALAEGIGGEDQIAMTGPAARAIEKIRGQLPSRVIDELGDVSQHIAIHLPATGPAREAIHDEFDRVSQAIRDRRALRCRYRSLNAASDDAEFLLHPYKLVFDSRAWYVIGFHHGRGEVRRLKLNRFDAVLPTDRPYMIPDDFSLEAYRGKAWRMIRGETTHRVAIRFAPEVSETVADTNWHPTQKIEDHPDGSITFRCEIDGLDEIVWWIMGYGPHAHVQEPAELADRIGQLAQATAGRYAQP